VLDTFQSPSLRGSGRFWPATGPKKPSSLVSIPFIAGQWSLPLVNSLRKALPALFQSPSLRGSGRFLEARKTGEGLIRFQSPSLRGSGRFSSSRWPETGPKKPSFNPLHCGAVVASWSAIALSPVPE